MADGEDERSLKKYLAALNYLGLDEKQKEQSEHGENDEEEENEENEAFPVPSLAEIRAMKKSGWWPNEDDLFHSHDAQIRNGVAFSALAYRDPNYPPLRIDVQHMATAYSHLNFQWKSSFPSAVWRLKAHDNTMNVTIQIHGGGSLHITGICHPNEYYAAVSLLIHIMETEMGFPPLKIAKRFNKCNIVVSGALPGRVSTDRLKETFPDIVQLRRDSFPGASLTLLTSGDQCVSKRIVALAFDSPNFVVVGWRAEEEYCNAVFPIFYCLWRAHAVPRKMIYIDRAAAGGDNSDVSSDTLKRAHETDAQSKNPKKTRGTVEVPVSDDEDDEEDEDDDEDDEDADDERESNPSPEEISE